MAFLDVEGLSVSFNGAPALRDVSFQVREHEAVAILGANGAGKSTLLRALMGRVPLVRGEISLDGVRIDQLRTSGRVARGLSLCPEGRQVFASMSIQDNLLLGAYLATSAEAERRLKSVYEDLPFLHDRRNEPAGSCSGGEQQLVAVGRALMAAPRVLLLDEPSSGLSPVAIATIREILQGIKRRGATVLLVEQNVQLSVALTSRCYVLSRGVVTTSGTTADLAQDPALANTYLSGSAGAGD